MLSYEHCKNNLEKFIDGLPSTDIRLLVYRASDLNNPTLNTRFHKWTFDGNVFYIAHGNEDACVIVYEESDLKKLLNGSFEINSVNIGIHKQGNGNVQIRSSAISYVDIDETRVTRNEDQCNFTIRDQNFNDIHEFGRIACESRYGEPTGATIQSIYTTVREKAVMFNLCNAILFGKGGVLVLRSQDPQPLNGTTGAFTRFISEEVLSNVINLRADLLSVKVIFDQGSGTQDITPKDILTQLSLSCVDIKNIVIIYDFEHDASNILYLSGPQGAYL